MFTNYALINKKYKKLSLLVKNKAGRSDTGRIIFRTNSSLRVKIKKIKINYSLRYLRLGTVASFSLIPFKNKLVSLILFNNGAACYYLTTENHILFSFMYSTTLKKLRKIKIKSLYFMLCYIKKLSFVSVLELTPGRGAQYVRSPGVKSRIINFDKIQHSCLLQLPSGTKKIFSYYSYAVLSSISMAPHKKFFNGKAGYWKIYGKKPLVRGVAMNPVDHPHGGRGKSIKYPRTPWGKTTKFK
uniref:Rpl2 n=1 Tax=Laurentiella strenua TaxID=114681 RepID=A0A2I4PES4_9SPIT|nr:rpl2 [Laurentiella strenua]